MEEENKNSQGDLNNQQNFDQGYDPNYNQEGNGNDNPFNQPSYTQNYGPGYINMEQPPKKSKKKLAIILSSVIGAAVLITLCLIFLPKIFMSDKTRVSRALVKVGTDMVSENPASVFADLGSEALAKNFRKNSMEAELGLEVSSIPSYYTEEMMISPEGFQINMDIAQDMVKKQLAGNIQFAYLDTDLMSFSLYGNEEDFCFSMPQLFEGYLRLPTENIVSSYNQSDLGENNPVPDNTDISLNLFKDIQEDAEILAIAAQAALDWSTLYGHMTVEKMDSDRTFTLDGRSVNTKKYVLTIAHKDYANLVKNLVRGYYNTEKLSKEYNVDPDMLESMASSVDEVFTNDIKVNVYLAGGDRVAAIELETVLSSEEEDSTLLFEVAFDKSSAYNQSYSGVLSLENAYDSKIININKTTVLTGDKADSEFAINANASDSVMNYVYSAGYDKKTGDYDYSIAIDTDSESIEFGMNGKLNQLDKGRAFDLGINDLYVDADGERFGFSGNISVGPMTGTIQEMSGQRYDLFAMSESEVTDLLTEVQENAYGFLMSLMGY